MIPVGKLEDEKGDEKDEKGDSGEGFEAVHVVWKRHDGYFVYR
jgi:hypothetical protein